LAALFADENFPQQVVTALRARGHDVLTAYEAGLANQRVRDEDILSEAARLGRTLLTLNRWEFVRLHAAHPEHSGIIVCTPDPDPDGQATRIDQALGGGDAAGQLLRVNRPPR